MTPDPIRSTHGPGLHDPPLVGARIMIGARIAWGVYSTRGKGAGDPIRVTAGNFLLTLPMAAVLGGIGPVILERQRRRH